MRMTVLNSDPDTKWQSFYTNLELANGGTVRVRFELRYLDATKKWYISIFNAETGKSYCRYVPMISGYYYTDDLLAPFGYKNIGHILCVVINDDATSENPRGDNLGDFGIVWSDELYAE